MGCSAGRGAIPLNCQLPQSKRMKLFQLCVKNKQKLFHRLRWGKGGTRFGVFGERAFGSLRHSAECFSPSISITLFLCIQSCHDGTSVPYLPVENMKQRLACEWINGTHIFDILIISETGDWLEVEEWIHAASSNQMKWISLASVCAHKLHNPYHRRIGCEAQYTRR